MDPDNLKYHKGHTWVEVVGKRAKIGITDYAQDELGDIVYVDLPEVDTKVEANTEMLEIESTKVTSSVIAPVSGTMIEVNKELEDSPEIINEDPYSKGWIAVIEMSDESGSEIGELIEADDYENYLQSIKKEKPA
ncbi:glycine cleavage system protein GcvH [Thermodesulfovibrionales bacterium]|nr:glycine cleavage system protein GcvH [Thermodesulfovibrionales bacterium]MCL0042169.1 glycine cleavage system protein GcvH [Thermodesulfovibrionales bacterium]